MHAFAWSSPRFCGGVQLCVECLSVCDDCSRSKAAIKLELTVSSFPSLLGADSGSLPGLPFARPPWFGSDARSMCFSGAMFSDRQIIAEKTVRLLEDSSRQDRSSKCNVIFCELMLPLTADGDLAMASVGQLATAGTIPVRYCRL